MGTVQVPEQKLKQLETTVRRLKRKNEQLKMKREVVIRLPKNKWERLDWEEAIKGVKEKLTEDEEGIMRMIQEMDKIRCYSKKDE